MVNFKFVVFGQSVQSLPIAVYMYAVVTSRGVPRPKFYISIVIIYVLISGPRAWSSSPKSFISTVDIYLLIGGPRVEFLTQFFLLVWLIYIY